MYAAVRITWQGSASKMMSTAIAEHISDEKCHVGACRVCWLQQHSAALWACHAARLLYMQVTSDLQDLTQTLAAHPRRTPTQLTHVKSMLCCMSLTPMPSSCPFTKLCTEASVVHSRRQLPDSGPAVGASCCSSLLLLLLLLTGAAVWSCFSSCTSCRTYRKCGHGQVVSG
jgi:hypothetical protein